MTDNIPWNTPDYYVDMTNHDLDPNMFHPCPICGQKPRVWIFNNGVFGKCRCNGRFDIAPVKGMSVMEHLQKFGDTVNYNHIDFIMNWNEYVKNKKV